MNFGVLAQPSKNRITTRQFRVEADLTQGFSASNTDADFVFDFFASNCRSPSPSTLHLVSNGGPTLGLKFEPVKLLNNNYLQQKGGTVSEVK